METFVNPPREKWQSLVERVRTDEMSIAESVASIVGRVRRDGDIALRQLSLEIDKVSLEGGCEVSQQEVEEAYSLVPQELRQAGCEKGRREYPPISFRTDATGGGSLCQ